MLGRIHASHAFCFLSPGDFSGNIRHDRSLLTVERAPCRSHSFRWLTLCGRTIMWQLSVIVAMTLLYFGMQELLRRCKLPILLGLFLLTPLILTPFWIKSNDFGPFLWIKTYSIMFCVSWGSWLRFTSGGDKALLRRTIAWLLAANILEALVLDILGTGIAHNLNALAGILLLATMPRSTMSTRIDRASRHQDIRYDVSLAWIVGYTLWNWVFVYLNYPALAGHHIAVLSAALILACIDPQRWLQTRAATLGLNLLFMATSYPGTIAVSDATGWFDERTAIIAASLSFAWLVIHALSKLDLTAQAYGYMVLRVHLWGHPMNCGRHGQS
jgi:hypothetical protein